MTRKPDRVKQGKRRRRKDNPAAMGARQPQVAQAPKAARSFRVTHLLSVLLLGLLLVSGFFIVSHLRSEDAGSGAAAAHSTSSPTAAATAATPPGPEMPRDIELSVQRALALSASHRGSEAAAILEKCLAQLRQDPSQQNATAHVDFLVCVAMWRAGRKDEALRRALAYLRDHPKDPPHNLIAGTCLYDQFRYGDAAVRLKTGLTASDADVRRVAMNPNDIRCQLADCYRVLGRAVEAQKTLEQILATQPDHSGARRTLGLVAFSHRDFSQAMELFESLHRQDPTNAMVTYSLARTALEIGQAERAVDAIQAHWKTGAKPEEGLCLYYAKALAALGRHKEAYHELAMLLVLNPDQDEAYFILANTLTRLGKPDLARPFFDRYRRRGKIRAEIDRAGTAARKGYPSSAAYYRGRAYAEAGRFSAAMTEFRKARQLAPGNGQVVAGLAAVFLDIDRPLDAQDLIDGFSAAADKQRLALPAELLIVKARVAWTLGHRQAAHQALNRAIAAGRCQRDIARCAARFSLLSSDPAPLAEALKHFENAARQTALDPEIKTWVGIRSLLDGKAEAARDLLEAALQSIPSPDPVTLLALGRAQLQLGNRTAAAEAFRGLVEKQDLLRPAWTGIQEAAVEAQEVSRAEAWLKAADGVEAQIHAQWQALRGEGKPHESAEALIRVSRLRNRLGMANRARALALLARDADTRNPQVHRQVLALCGRPEDIFVRLHSLEYLVRMVPGDQDLAKQRVREYERLDITPPAVRARQKSR